MSAIEENSPCAALRADSCPRAFRIIPNLCLALFLTVPGCARGPGEVQAVVLVTLDTTRADRIGCYGNGAIRTPALDGVAQEGVLFDHASATAPLTLPSHTSIMTGRIPGAHGVRHNGMYAIPDSERTLAEVFKKHGFETAAFVASFPLASPFGLSQGFDTYDETFEPARDQSGFLSEERDSAHVNAAVLPWLGRMKGKKFFLWVHYFDPHAPYNPPSPFRERCAGNLYDGEIAFMDSSLATLLERLAEEVPPERTVLAIAADHGESLRQHGEATHGLLIYEATIRVPFLLRARGRLPAGVRIEEPVSLVDVFPTLLSLAGLREEAEKGPLIQGRDLIELVSSRTAPGGARAAPAGPGSEVVFESLVGWIEHGWGELHGIRSGRWKYIKAPRPELYDLSSDPGEVRNLLEAPGPEAADRAADLDRRLEAVLKAAAAQASAGPAHREMDDETLEKLRSLGYLPPGARSDPRARAEAPSASGGESRRGASLEDPKDMVGFFEALNDAGLLARKGDLEGALASYRSLLERAPGDPAIQRRCAETLLEMKSFDALERFLAPLREREALQGGGLTYFWLDGILAKVSELKGDNEKAIALYRSALTKDPDYASNAIRIALLLRRSGRIEESLREAERILQRRPSYLAAYEIAADDQRGLGRPDAAAELWRKASLIAPDNPRVLAPLGRLLLETKRIEEARKVCEHLAKVAPGQADGPLLLGALAVVEGRPSEAVALLQQARQLDPKSADALYWLGNAYTESRDYASAEGPLLEMVKRFPDAYLGYRALGRLRQEQNRSDEAITAFRRALALNPSDEFSRRSLQELSRRP